MNIYEQQLNTLRLEHSARMRSIWDSYEIRINQTRRTLKTLSDCPGKEQIKAQLAELLRLMRADRDRKISKEGRAYRYENKRICAEMKAHYLTSAV